MALGMNAYNPYAQLGFGAAETQGILGSLSTNSAAQLAGLQQAALAAQTQQGVQPGMVGMAPLGIAAPPPPAFGVMSPMAAMSTLQPQYGATYYGGQPLTAAMPSGLTGSLANVGSAIGQMQSQIVGLMNQQQGGSFLQQPQVQTLMSQMGMTPPLNFEDILFLFMSNTESQQQQNITNIMQQPQNQPGSTVSATSGNNAVAGTGLGGVAQTGQTSTATAAATAAGLPGGALGGNASLVSGGNSIGQSTGTNTQGSNAPDSNMQMQQISMLMQNMQQMESMVTNVLGMMHSTADAIIQNIH